MSELHRWASMPAARRAAEGGDYATVFRLARIGAGLTLEQVGAIGGYSASTLSRLESGRRPVHDVDELRRLARIYDVPPALLGLAAATEAAGGSTLATTVDGGSDVRRRSFIAGTAAVGMSLALPDTAADAAPGSDTIEDVLFGRVTAEPMPSQQLAAQLAAARADHRATRYTRLARRLPRLLAQATASHTAAPVSQHAFAAGQLAEAYGIATQLLIKLHDNGMALTTADRAVQAATRGDDPLIMAESQRLAATVLRRIDHRDTAQHLVLSAAAQLRATTQLPDTAHQAMYGRLLAVAAYTAAVRDDRDTAWNLLGEAHAVIGPAHTADRFNAIEIAVYRISVARKLGDYGAAVDYSSKIDPSRITAPERRARYWEDTALALQGRGRPAAAFDALLSAERDVPEDVRYRPWAQQLTRELLRGSASHGLSNVREFAARVGVS